MRVLVVEDDAALRALVCEVLEDRGHEVVELDGDPSETESALGTPFPLVLLDWVLGQADGLEICRRIRARHGDRSYVVVLTGRNKPEDLVEVLAAGADDYLPKPFSLESFEVRLAVAERNAVNRQARLALETERSRLLDEVQRAQTRLHRLLGSAMAAHIAESERGVWESLGAAVTGAGLNVHIAIAEPPRGDDIPLVIRHAAFPDGLLPAVERVMGRPVVGIELDGARVWPYPNAIRENRVIAVPDAAAWLRQALPWLGERALRLFARLRGVGQGACAPITDGQHVFGVLSVWGESLSEADLPTLGLLGLQAGSAVAALRLRDAETSRAKLDGALKTARRITHELGNSLGYVRGYAELLPQLDPGEAPELADDLAASVDQASRVLAQLQRIVRFEETEFGGMTMLDLDAATGHG